MQSKAQNKSKSIKARQSTKPKQAKPDTKQSTKWKLNEKNQTQHQAQHQTKGEGVEGGGGTGENEKKRSVSHPPNPDFFFWIERTRGHPDTVSSKKTWSLITQDLITEQNGTLPSLPGPMNYRLNLATDHVKSINYRLELTTDNSENQEKRLPSRDGLASSIHVTARTITKCFHLCIALAHVNWIDVKRADTRRAWRCHRVGRTRVRWQRLADVRSVTIRPEILSAISLMFEC